MRLTDRQLRSLVRQTLQEGPTDADLGDALTELDEIIDRMGKLSSHFGKLGELRGSKVVRMHTSGMATLAADIQAVLDEDEEDDDWGDMAPLDPEFDEREPY